MSNQRSDTANYALLKGKYDIAKIAGMIKKYGLGSGTRRVLKALRGRYVYISDCKFDEEFNVRTSGSAELSTLTITDGEAQLGEKYEPTWVALFPSFMSVLPRNLEEFVFVDFGAGKGRVVLLAAGYNFKKIIGIEFAEELHHAMQDNIARYSNPKQRCFDFAAVCMDAKNFQIPNGKCVLYFCNPFKKDLLSQVAENIRKSYLNNPRTIYVLFLNPDEKNGVLGIFDQLNIFTKRSKKICLSLHDMSHIFRTPVDLKFFLISTRDFAIYQTDD